MNSLARTYERSANVARLIPISQDTVSMLPRMLKHIGREDPFSRSAAYYAMTGRKGFWVYGNDQTAMLIAAHPNKDGSLLFFPPNGANPAGLIEDALANPFSLPPADNWELARLGHDDLGIVAALGKSGAVSQPHAEGTLDWTYPVHVVDPKPLITREGKAFNSFRGHINRARTEGYQGGPVDIKQHKQAISTIIDQWAVNRKRAAFSYDDLTSPTRAVLNLMESGDLDIHGTISFDRDGKPIGFWLWEQVDGEAMSLVRAYLKRPGNAEFGILNMAEQLVAGGISHMNTGGSETENLNHFKESKMRPEKSIPLQTVTLHPHFTTALLRKTVPFGVRL